MWKRLKDSNEQVNQVVFTSSPTLPSSSQSASCTFCGISGHTENSCFRKEKAAKQARANAQRLCEKRRGKGRKGQKAHAAQEEKSAEFAGNASATDYTNPQSPLISDTGQDWIADTGATCHMTPHRHWFTKYASNHTPIRLANNQVIYSVGMGTVCFQPTLGGKPGQLLEFE